MTDIQNNVDKEFGAGKAKVSPISKAITVEMDGFIIIVLNLGQCADHYGYNTLTFKAS